MRWIIVCALFAGCGDNEKVPTRDDAGIDAPADAQAARTGCLDRPSVDPAPNGQLPCDLIPPGLML